MQRIIGLLSAILLGALAGLAIPALADEGNRAGLLIQFGDGRVETRCIAFEGDEIDGADLLSRSGLAVVVDASGMGVRVCQIEGLGCVPPAKACFCQCMGGGECAYWNYYYLDPGETQWVYSPLGALMRKVRPGTVESWVWGNGKEPPAGDWTFDAICLPPAPTAMPTVAATTTPEATAPPTRTDVPELPSPTPDAGSATLPPTMPPALTATATASPFPTQAATPSPAPVAGDGQSLVEYWPFGLMVLVLVLAGAFVWSRSRS